MIPLQLLMLLHDKHMFCKKINATCINLLNLACSRPFTADESGVSVYIKLNLLDTPDVASLSFFRFSFPGEHTAHITTTPFPFTTRYQTFSLHTLASLFVFLWACKEWEIQKKLYKVSTHTLDPSFSLLAFNLLHGCTLYTFSCSCRKTLVCLVVSTLKKWSCNKRQWLLWTTRRQREFQVRKSNADNTVSN